MKLNIGMEMDETQARRMLGCNDQLSVLGNQNTMNQVSFLSSN